MLILFYPFQSNYLFPTFLHTFQIVLLSEDNFDFKDFNRIFHLRKYKKKEINQNIISRNIVLSNDRNENFIIPLYNDIDIYGKNNFIRSSFQNEYNSNAKDIKNKKNLYLINLEEGIFSIWLT